MSGSVEGEDIFTDNERKDLECPVCIRVPRKPPIYQCKNGHLLCSDCHSKLTYCPTCRTRLGKIRSLMFERILSKIQHNCKNFDHGCKVKGLLTTLDEHEKDCTYRFVNCGYLSCKDQVPIEDVVEHLKTDHNLVKFLESEKFEGSFYLHVDSRRAIRHPRAFKLGDKHFLHECWLREDGQWHVWVYMIGSKKECQKHIYTIKIISSNTRETLTYSGPCVSLDMDKETVAEMGRCLTFPNTIAQRLSVDNKLMYEGEVKSTMKNGCHMPLLCALLSPQLILHFIIFAMIILVLNAGKTLWNIFLT